MSREAGGSLRHKKTKDLATGSWRWSWARGGRVDIGLDNGSFGTILLGDLKWARQWLEGVARG